MVEKFQSAKAIKEQIKNQKYASLTLRFLENLCRNNGWAKIWLTVNNNNTNSIAAYQAMGFHAADTQVADIGNGFVMDDYIMEKIIEQ